MPYDTLVWGEEVQSVTLLGVLGKGPGDYITSGDTLLMKKGNGAPFLFAGGGVSDTKPNGAGVTPQFSNSNQIVHLPAALNFAGEGWLDLRKSPLHALALQEGEELTGLMCDTNVNEGEVLGAHLAYGGVPPLDMGHKSYQSIHIPLCTVTSTAAVTYNSGTTPLTTAANETYWVDKSGKYELLGVVGHISAATFGGILHVTGLAGEWKGYYPGVPINPLSAVTFTPQQPFTPFAEPIPFDGDAVPNIGMTATTAGAIGFGMVIGRV